MALHITPSHYHRIWIGDDIVITIQRHQERRGGPLISVEAPRSIDIRHSALAPEPNGAKSDKPEVAVKV